MKHTVLVVEDDLMIQKLLAAVLRRKGLSVDLASGGQEAIEKVKRNHYSVVLTDLMMPGVSGFDVVRWLKEHPDQRPKSLIIITAAGRGVLPQLDDEVVNAVILKPFDASLVAAYVRTASDLPVDRRRKRLIA